MGYYHYHPRRSGFPEIGDTDFDPEIEDTDENSLSLGDKMMNPDFQIEIESFPCRSTEEECPSLADWRKVKFYECNSEKTHKILKEEEGAKGKKAMLFSTLPARV